MFLNLRLSTSGLVHVPCTYQCLVNDAEHVGVVQEDVGGVCGIEGDVSDRCVSLQPQRVKTSSVQSSTPLCVRALLHRELTQLDTHTDTHTHGHTQTHTVCLLSVLSV